MSKGQEALIKIRPFMLGYDRVVDTEYYDIIEKELEEKEKQDFILKHLRKDVAIEYEIEQLEEEYKRSKK